MKAAALILVLLTLHVLVFAQRVQTLVPPQPVVLGTAFQVQYVVADGAGFLSASTPTFPNFRLVSGPNYYKGTATANGKAQPIQNIAYTLVPLAMGTLSVEGIRVQLKDGTELTAPSETVTVVPQPKASFSARSSYTDAQLYAPASSTDLKTLIGQNLFVKAGLSRATCYEGEAIVATYKLYSRLQSVSEAERSPAFYGFGIVDMADIRKAHIGVERVDGKVFNTSVLRQVQLYPIRSGNLQIDQMFIHNEITFQDSAGGAEQHTENNIVTPQLSVSVKPLPPGRPDNFTGAVGDFSIHAALLKDVIRLNEQGRLVVTVKGSGNFIQFGQPLVQWPDGVDGFEPVVTEDLNRNEAPLKGQVRYEFGFTADSAGHVTLPPLSFSFFDPRTATYRTLTTAPLSLKVLPAEKKSVKLAARNGAILLPLLIGLILACTVAYFLFKRKRKTVAPEAPVPKGPDHAAQLRAIRPETLSPPEVCRLVLQILNDYLKQNEALPKEKYGAVKAITADCQLLLYTGTTTDTEATGLLKRAIVITDPVVK